MTKVLDGGIALDAKLGAQRLALRCAVDVRDEGSRAAVELIHPLYLEALRIS